MHVGKLQSLEFSRQKGLLGFVLDIIMGIDQNRTALSVEYQEE